MLPLFVVSLNLDYTRAGVVLALLSLVSSLAQPCFGYLADRFGGRIQGPLGIAWMSICVGMVGFAPDYFSLLAMMFLAGLGSGAFHPQGAMHASIIGGKRKGSALSVYVLGGNVGSSFAPMVGGLLFLAYGLRGSALLAIPGLIIAALVYRAQAELGMHRKTPQAAPAGSRGRPSIPVVAVASLSALIMLRTWATSGLNNFIPLWYRSLGYPIDVASQVLFVLLLGLALGGVMGGFISDRIGRVKVVFLSLVLLSPTMYLFMQLPPPLSFVVAAPLGLLMGASFSVTIVMGQEFLPQNVGMVSGLTMGLSFVTGSIGLTAIGIAADTFGLSNTLGVLAFLPIVAALLCWNLRTTRAVARDGG